MQQEQNICDISVTWRGKKFALQINLDASLKELGHELQRLTDVKADTIRLIVASNKNSKLLSPFSDEHSSLNLRETPIVEGKPIKMMGVPQDEVDEVLKNAKTNLRIAGFDEEEKRLRQRMLDGPHTSLSLPQGSYIFCDFRTLHLPGIELNPPASEALRLMHTLAADPGIVAIMNKHRWRVGIMTEMAPEGYVGVSPKCILGFNKNHGEEISLRLRTDDLEGFRKYESIKKTLLHELAHMVYSEHDAKFKALDNQLNQEAAALDWTKSRSHTLSEVRHPQHHENGFRVVNYNALSQKLGGKAPDHLVNARASSVAAAYRRLVHSSSEQLKAPKTHEEPDPDDFEFDTPQESELVASVGEEELNIAIADQALEKLDEPDPDDSEGSEPMDSEPYAGTSENRITIKTLHKDLETICSKTIGGLESNFLSPTNLHEPDPDDSGARINDIGNVQRLDCIEPDPDDSQVHGVLQQVEVVSQGINFSTPADEPNPDDLEIQRIQDPVKIVCTRLQKAIEMLRSEVNPSEVTTVLQTLFKIVRNVIEHPNEMKFKKLRKGNPVIRKNVVNYRAAMEILMLIGFNEDIVSDEIGKVETYLVLKRNDPGLLWLARSSLETCIAY